MLSKSTKNGLGRKAKWPYTRYFSFVLGIKAFGKEMMGIESER